ncbi:MAG TPA: hypothetical protein VIJ39_08850 [Solirubrobacteraceae bacterium]
MAPAASPPGTPTPFARDTSYDVHALLDARRMSPPTTSSPSGTVSQRTPASLDPAHRTAARPDAPYSHTPFGVPFNSAMSDADIAHLAAELNMTTCFHPKLHPAVAPLGFARLDFYSGLFLHRGKRDCEWVLECRTWGQPAPDTVHEWQVLTAAAARMLDPSVPVPSRAQAPSRPEIAPPPGHLLRRRRPR